MRQRMRMMMGLSLLTGVLGISGSAHAGGGCAAYGFDFGRKSPEIMAFDEVLSDKVELSQDARDLLFILEKKLHDVGCLLLVYESPNRLSLALHRMTPRDEKDRERNLEVNGKSMLFAPTSNDPLPTECFTHGTESFDERADKCYEITIKKGAKAKRRFESYFTAWNGSGDTMREALKDGMALTSTAYATAVLDAMIAKLGLGESVETVAGAFKMFGRGKDTFKSDVLHYAGYNPDLTVTELWSRTGHISEAIKKRVRAALMLDKSGLVFVDSQLGGPKLVAKSELKLPSMVASVGHDPLAELYKTLEKAGFTYDDGERWSKR